MKNKPGPLKPIYLPSRRTTTLSHWSAIFIEIENKIAIITEINIIMKVALEPILSAFAAEYQIPGVIKIKNDKLGITFCLRIIFSFLVDLIKIKNTKLDY